MHSCWLSLFDECAETLAFVSTETVFEGRRHHLTEKSFKPICLRMPFVLVSTAGSLEYLRSYGFQTFGSIWDESYDTETDDAQRLAKIADLLHSLDQLTDAEKQARFEAAIPIIEHNFNHFYSGAFEQILWQELVDMLDTMQQDFAQ
jgi:predicted XRE-type DNA-binding protein